jgi:hypothetical protein
MNISKSEILRKLPIYNNFGKVLVKDQNTSDIIKAIVKAHEANKSDYNKICSLFYTGDEIGTAKNIFNYIKKNVKYVIEPDDLQQIKNASAFFATPSSDCKNYALAINGILDACRRKYGFNCELYYRFAAYDGSKTPQHVFAVMVINGEEIWIDPVLDYFNEDKRPNYFKDKKINNMALMALSGVDPYKNIQNAENRSLSGFNFSNISSLISSPAASGALSLIPGGPLAGQILSQISSLFSKKANRNDWAGWDALDVSMGGTPGSSVYYWIINDGDSVENEANNILSYITKKQDGLKNIIDSANSQYRNSNVDDVMQKLYAKLDKGGYSAEAKQIKEALAPPTPAPPVLPGGPNTGSESGSGTQTAGVSPLIILALVGAGAAMFLRKK